MLFIRFARQIENISITISRGKNQKRAEEFYFFIFIIYDDNKFAVRDRERLL